MNNGQRNDGSGLAPIAYTIAAGILAAIPFIAFPGLDLAASSLFTDAGTGFPHGSTGPVRIARGFFNLLFAGFCVVVIAGLAVTLLLRRHLGRIWPRWLYLGLSAIAGPGLVANLLLKDNWGRARPVQIEQFGGDALFTPALFLSDQCQRNCSFVSGEASSIYLMFFALAMAIPAGRVHLALAGIVLGSVAGMVRMAAGGHFLSDVVFAGIFMALVAQTLHRLMLSDRQT